MAIHREYAENSPFEIPFSKIVQPLMWKNHFERRKPNSALPPLGSSKRHTSLHNLDKHSRPMDFPRSPSTGALATSGRGLRLRSESASYLDLMGTTLQFADSRSKESAMSLDLKQTRQSPMAKHKTMSPCASHLSASLGELGGALHGSETRTVRKYREARTIAQRLTVEQQTLPIFAPPNAGMTVPKGALSTDVQREADDHQDDFTSTGMTVAEEAIHSDVTDVHRQADDRQDDFTKFRRPKAMALAHLVTEDPAEDPVLFAPDAMVRVPPGDLLSLLSDDESWCDEDEYHWLDEYGEEEEV